MNTLIIYYSKIPLNKDRFTIKDSVFSFKNHLPGNTNLVNYINGQPSFLFKFRFDLIIIHYSLLSIKYSNPRLLLSISEKIKYLNGYKIAFPQDEYLNSNYLNDFFKTIKLDRLYTLFYDKNDIRKVYPFNKTGISNIHTVLPGYISCNMIKPEEQILPFEKRKIDIGYRARKNPFWLGEFSLRKWEIAERFLKFNKGEKVFDISTKAEDTILGEKWLDFIENCRFFLGVEGGASLLDKDGAIRKRVELITLKNPDVSFQEVFNKYLKKYDNKINYFMITPRIFEAISRKSCLILMEGYYSGILIANKHYIPLKNDYSNIEEVLDKLDDYEYVKNIIETSYNDIILKQKYTYKNHINEVIEQLREVGIVSNDYKTTNRLLLFSYTFIHHFITSIKCYFIWIFRYFKRFNNYFHRIISNKIKFNHKNIILK